MGGNAIELTVAWPRLSLWCIEDIFGPLSVLAIFLAFLVFLGRRLPSMMRSLAWTVVTGITAGELTRRAGLAIPGSLLVLTWALAALGSGKACRSLWTDVRNHESRADDRRWTTAVVTSAALLLGGLFAGYWFMAEIANRSFDVTVWTALTVGMAAMAGMNRLYPHLAEKVRTALPGSLQSHTIAMGVLGALVLVQGCRATLWIAEAREAFSGETSLTSHGAPPHLTAIRTLSALSTATNPLDAVERAQHAAEGLGRSALDNHLEAYVPKSERWPVSLAVGGQLLEPETTIVAARMDVAARQTRVLMLDRLLLQDFSGKRESETELWPQTGGPPPEPVAMTVAPPGSVVNDRETKFVVASNGRALAIVEGRTTEVTAVPIPEGNVCRDAVWLDGLGLLALLGDGAVLRGEPHTGGIAWKAHWEPLANLLETKVAKSLAPLPDGSGAYVLDAFGGVHPHGNVPIQYHLLGGHRFTPHYFHPNRVATRGYVLDEIGRVVVYGDRYGGVHGILFDGERVTYTGTTSALDPEGACRDYQVDETLDRILVFRADGTLMVYPGTEWLLGR